MTHPAADLALLDTALCAIERLLAHADSGVARTPASRETQEPMDGGPMSPAQTSLHICLNSAAALLDVSRSLLSTAGEREPDDLEREWKTLITLTKSASRSAYRATLIMAAQRNLVTAQAAQAQDDHSIAHPRADPWR
jgi:hypothetical protein